MYKVNYDRSNVSFIIDNKKLSNCQIFHQNGIQGLSEIHAMVNITLYTNMLFILDL